jgi:hypothetical protein
MKVEFSPFTLHPSTLLLFLLTESQISGITQSGYDITLGGEFLIDITAPNRGCWIFS